MQAGEVGVFFDRTYIILGNAYLQVDRHPMVMADHGKRVGGARSVGRPGHGEGAWGGEVAGEWCRGKPDKRNSYTRSLIYIQEGENYASGGENIRHWDY